MPPRKTYGAYVPDIEAGGNVVKNLELSPTGRIQQADVDISQLQRSVEELRKLYAQLKEVVGDEKEVVEGKIKDHTARMKQQVNTTITAVRKLQQEQEYQDQQAELLLAGNRLEELSALVGGDAIRYRERKASIANLKASLARIQEEVVALEDKVRHEQTKLVRSQMQTALNQPVSEEQAREVMDTPGALQQILESSMLDRSGVVLQDTLDQLQGRLNAAEALARDALAIKGMFEEMSTLLNSQGQAIDDISWRVEVALGKVRKGNKQLGTAGQYMKTAMKTKACLYITLAAIIAIIILVALFASGTV